jgi:hypothetical protein
MAGVGCKACNWLTGLPWLDSIWELAGPIQWLHPMIETAP